MSFRVCSKNVQTSELSHRWNFLYSIRSIFRHTCCVILGLCMFYSLYEVIDIILIYYRF